MSAPRQHITECCTAANFPQEFSSPLAEADTRRRSRPFRQPMGVCIDYCHACVLNNSPAMSHARTMQLFAVRVTRVLCYMLFKNIDSKQNSLRHAAPSIICIPFIILIAFGILENISILL